MPRPVSAHRTIDDTYMNESAATWNLYRAVLGGASVPVASGAWNESRAIAVPVDGLSAGTYVNTLEIHDGFGGMAQDKVVLVVSIGSYLKIDTLDFKDELISEKNCFVFYITITNPLIEGPYIWKDKSQILLRKSGECRPALHAEIVELTRSVDKYSKNNDQT